jgi:hypothetical protein
MDTLTVHQLQYLKQKAKNPNFSKDKYQQQKRAINSNLKSFASNKYSKQRTKAINNRNISWKLNRDNTIKQMIDTTHCQISGRKLIFEVGHDDSPSIDRINSKLGYSSRNIQIVTSRINQAKNTMTDEEFIEMCESVTKHQRKLRKLKQKE